MGGSSVEMMARLAAFGALVGLVLLIVHLVRKAYQIDTNEYKKHAAEEEVRAAARVTAAAQQSSLGPSAVEKFFIGALALAFILAGFAVLGLQAYWYLQWGEWTPISVIDVARWVIADVAKPNGLQSWIVSPDSWYGLHRILDWIPVSVALWGIGFCFACGLDA